MIHTAVGETNTHIPAAPAPETVLPAINISTFWATPQTNDPVSKMMIADNKTHFAATIRRS